MTEVRVPDIGDYDDVPVVEVLVSAGDTVTAEQPLIVLESDKASMEVPSPAEGTVGEVSVSVGDTVSKGDLILTLSENGAGGGGEEPDDDAEPAEDDEPAEDAEPAEDEGGEPDAGESRPEAAGEEADQEAVGDEAPEPAEPDDDEPDGDGADGASDGVYAGPGARRLARELGVDLAAVSGSGRKGRITKEDVTASAEGGDGGEPATQKAAKEETPAAPAIAGLPPWPTVDHASFGPVETVGLSRIKRIAGPNLARNWVAIPHVTQHDDADITKLEAFRQEVNAEHAEEGVKLTMVSLLMKACAVALRAFPEFNSSLAGDELVLKRYYNLGFAADTPEGLMVPVIRDVDRKGLLDIARELAQLSQSARDGSLTREAMQGGTFTISSLGGIGGTYFTPIINAPEVAILGVSRSQTRPVWDGRAFMPRLILPLSLSYDHRVVDGAAAARFTTHLGELLRDPVQMLL